MSDRLIQAHTIAKDAFSRKINAATDERNLVMDVLTRCEPDTLSASDLELLAADGKGFCALVGARVAV